MAFFTSSINTSYIHFLQFVFRGAVGKNRFYTEWGCINGIFKHLMANQSLLRLQEKKKPTKVYCNVTGFCIFLY